MKERPILFSGEMVKAILEGRKTQTRRPLKTQPVDILPMNVPNEWVCLLSREPERGAVVRCRYGEIGDRLWVRETWMDIAKLVGVDRAPVYRADGENMSAGSLDHPGEWRELPNKEYHWRPSIHMPRWASRITLEITEIRVERVKDISQADAKAEGAVPWYYTADGMRETEHGWEFSIENCPEEKRDYRFGFQLLWDSINERRGFGWKANPFVWVITFKRLTP